MKQIIRYTFFLLSREREFAETETQVFFEKLKLLDLKENCVQIYLVAIVNVDYYV